MQAQEALQKALKKLAAKTHGQQAEVRTIMGRQIGMLHSTTEMFMMPYSKTSPIQDLDPASPTYGEFYFMVDFDTIDGTIIG